MKQTLKQFLTKNFATLAYFYRYLRYRLVVMLVASILVGFMDGLGLAMFLPLLELLADQNAQASSDQMGNLAFILDGLRWMGLSLNLTVVLLTMLVFFLLKGVAKYFESYLQVIYQQFFIRAIRVENIDALTNYSYNVFVSADAGKIQNTLSGEVQRVIQGFKTYNHMLQQLVLIINYSVLAFLANPHFAALVVLGGLLSNFLFSVLYKKTKRLSKQLVTRNHGFQGLLLQEVAFFKYLKATGSIRKYAKELKKKVYAIEETTRNIGVLNSIMQGVREPLMIFIVVGVILIQVKLMGGALSTIILSLLFFYRGLTAVTQLQTNYNKFLGASGSLANMQAFIAELKKHRRKNGKITIESFEDRLELRDVGFAYENFESILKNIRLSIAKNETVALVGESGSGKTTLMNVMSGLLIPSSGHLYIDGQEGAKLDMISFQKRIGYITQEPVIFDDSVFNNVTFWAEPTDENIDRFWEALRKAHIAEFVKEQKEGIEARLGNNGINLSGGQKQRISIARELYKDVDLLFMDEATSALDSETEKQIQSNIEKLKGQYTIIIIAHRLSTIKNADRVVVMRNGQIEQEGSYKELIQKSVSFNKMVELQEI